MRRLLVPALAALILATPAHAGVSRSERAQINRTIDAFVRDGVRHENLAAAYDLTTPTFRGGVLRAQWAKGDTPIYPYPARGTSWHGWTLDYALKNDVAFELFLQPRAGASVDPTSFSGEVKKAFDPSGVAPMKAAGRVPPVSGWLRWGAERWTVLGLGPVAPSRR